MKDIENHFTVSFAPYKYDDFIIDRFMESVRQVALEKDAIKNISIILDMYDKRKTFWQRLKALLYL